MLKPFSIMTRPGRKIGLLLSIFPFVLFIFCYIYVADKRHKENPDDQLVPLVNQIWDGFVRSATELDKRKGTLDEIYPNLSNLSSYEEKQLVRFLHISKPLHFVMNSKPSRFILTVWNCRLCEDTVASGKRFLKSVAILSLAVLLGLYMGVFPCWEAVWIKFMTYFDKIPPLALLPIIFIFLGVMESTKISLMVLGVFPTICMDTYLRAKAVPKEQVIKGLTLAASNLEIAHKIVFPQIFPQVLDTIRLNFKALIIFLIAAESIAAEVGLGYRIYIVRRYLAMDVIIAYVLWTAALAFLIDLIVKIWIKNHYSWSEAK